MSKLDILNYAIVNQGFVTEMNDELNCETTYPLPKSHISDVIGLDAPELVYVKSIKLNSLIKCANDYNADSYPSLQFKLKDNPNEIVLFAVNSHQIIKCLSQVDCSAKGDIRYYLNGVLFAPTSATTTDLVATDGHRMGLATLQHERSEAHLLKSPAVKSLDPLTRNYIVPNDAIKILLSHLTKLKIDCEVKASVHFNKENNCGFFIKISYGNTEHLIKTIDGEFPSYGKFFSGHYENVLHATVDLKSFKSTVFEFNAIRKAIKANVFSEVSMNFDIENQFLRLKSKDVGFEKHIPMQFKGRSLNTEGFKYSIVYFYDYLKSLFKLENLPDSITLTQTENGIIVFEVLGFKCVVMRHI